jgi:hypothetical protein
MSKGVNMYSLQYFSGRAFLPKKKCQRSVRVEILKCLGCLNFFIFVSFSLLQACVNSPKKAVDSSQNLNPHQNAVQNSNSKRAYSEMAQKVVSPEAPLVAEAKVILENATTSQYEHVANIDEKAGKYNFDCSGFLTFALEKRSPEALMELRSHALVEIMNRKKHKRPLAKDFVSYFSRLNDGEVKAKFWKPVAKIEDLQPGDVLAWKTPEDSDTSNTGHVMIVKTKPQKSSEFPDEYLVQIIDSTSTPHGKADLRHSQKLTGIGIGTIALVANAQGNPIAYKWSGGESKKTKRTQIEIARPLVGANALNRLN